MFSSVDIEHLLPKQRGLLQKFELKNLEPRFDSQRADWEMRPKAQKYIFSR